MYLCVDLKSFYASCECAERNLDPFKTNLVVADSTRGEGTICLAVTPKMKSYGVSSRARIFEIPKDITYIKAKPRMMLYMKYSQKIYGIYLRYVSKDDIHVYSIDEVFIDATKYLKLYGLNEYEFSRLLMNEVYKETKITATCGIGTNLYLAKVALDIMSKHDKSNVWYLDEDLYKKLLWNHTPLTDFWRIGIGTCNRLSTINVFDMEGISKTDPNVLKKLFGIDYEILLDHSLGKEPCTISDIKNYKSKDNSLSLSQILFEDYSYNDAFTIVKEMVDVLSLELIDRLLVTNRVSLYIGYSKDLVNPTGGSKKLDYSTNLFSKLLNEVKLIFDKTTNKFAPIRRIGISFDIYNEDYELYDLFEDSNKIQREKDLEKTINIIKNKYGKNSVLRGLNFDTKANQIKRNKLIGGHNSGENE